MVYDRTRKVLSAFAGSTVPNRRSMNFAARNMGIGNLMASGSYYYEVGPHSKGRYPGNLRQQQRIATRRLTSSIAYGITDTVALGFVFNNLHPSFRDARDPGAKFSSFGSITVEGRQSREGDKAFEGPIVGFRAALGLSPGPDFARDNGKQVGLILLTGLEAAIASELLSSGAQISKEDRQTYLSRIRFGSKGKHVAKLQDGLGLSSPDGHMASNTIEALANLQVKKLGWWDGLYSPEMDRRLGLCVYGTEGCTSAKPEPD